MWNKSKFTFIISDVEAMTGRLGYIAETSPWLQIMMAYMYTSITCALGDTQAYLIQTSCNFRHLPKTTKAIVKAQAAAPAVSTTADNSIPYNLASTYNRTRNSSIKTSQPQKQLNKYITLGQAFVSQHHYGKRSHSST